MFLRLSFFIFVLLLGSIYGNDLSVQVIESKINTEAIFPKTDPETIGLIYQLLKVLDIELENNNIPYWVDFGVLLGAMRHGGMIPWDDDADVCVPYKYSDQLKGLTSQFEKYGLVLEPVYLANQDYVGEMVLKRATHGRPVLEIFFVQKDKTTPDRRILLMNKMPKQWFPNAYWYKKEISNLIRIPFGPIEVNCPAKGVMRHLNTQYGDDCMTMAVFWNHTAGRIIKEKVEIHDFSPAEYIDDGSIIPLD